jgi:hypothetical protein
LEIGLNKRKSWVIKGFSCIPTFVILCHLRRNFTVQLRVGDNGTCWADEGDLFRSPRRLDDRWNTDAEH